MSDDFIPFDQSTPVRGGSQGRYNNHKHQRPYQNHWRRPQNGFRGYGNSNRSWSNNSPRNNSFANNSTSSENRSNIDAYLHPSMLEDPWEQLEKKVQHNTTV